MDNDDLLLRLYVGERAPMYAVLPAAPVIAFGWRDSDIAPNSVALAHSLDAITVFAICG